MKLKRGKTVPILNSRWHCRLNVLELTVGEGVGRGSDVLIQLATNVGLIIGTF